MANDISEIKNPGSVGIPRDAYTGAFVFTALVYAFLVYSFILFGGIRFVGMGSTGCYQPEGARIFVPAVIAFFSAMGFGLWRWTVAARWAAFMFFLFFPAARWAYLFSEQFPSYVFFSQASRLNISLDLLFAVDTLAPLACAYLGGAAGEYFCTRAEDKLLAKLGDWQQAVIPRTDAEKNLTAGQWKRNRAEKMAGEEESVP
jgi:hypothetical protein